MLHLPARLAQLPEYRDAPAVAALLRHSDQLDKYSVTPNPWHDWRGIFEYLECVEFARNQLAHLASQVPSSDVGFQARYHSVNLVFFAQAMLDNMAMWLCDKLPIAGLAMGNRAFHKGYAAKPAFRPELTAALPGFEAVFVQYEQFVVDLEKYRRAWIHRLAGGASMFSDLVPSDPAAKITIEVPLNPEIALRAGRDGQEYLELVDATRAANGGRWLQPIDEFGDRFADAARQFTLDSLDVVTAGNPWANYQPDPEFIRPFDIPR